MLTKETIEAILKTIPDPELGISVWDLGLIYGITLNEGGRTVTIRMTLTSIGCPLFTLIADPIKEAIGKLEGVEHVEVELTFEPAWTPERLTEEAKAHLGMI